MSDLHQSADPLVILEKIFTLLEAALDIYPLSVELHVFKFKLHMNDPREEESNVMSMLDEFRNDRMYGPTVVQLLSRIEKKEGCDVSVSK